MVSTTRDHANIRLSLRIIIPIIVVRDAYDNSSYRSEMTCRDDQPLLYLWKPQKNEKNKQKKVKAIGDLDCYPAGQVRYAFF
jgi:hypothetical protein